MICETFGEDSLELVRLWEMIHKDSHGFTRICETLGEDL